ncbi:hypothetical protein Uis1B_0401 [Bifidobacterium margollesii]|uniref:Glycosyltransferase RgtA/B/C/D-like domain-containing protein n=1 Tax=Bifidobacterium margollesii TaxID=2020964 RepID=A0A2N5JCB5_9BIFI|nr:hypothetical protein [Bifidobacterium margollesii]PLS31862.1 hypothetical protein Uis1B_0401 [Bifidobacterium margollesii]
MKHADTTACAVSSSRSERSSAPIRHRLVSAIEPLVFIVLAMYYLYGAFVLESGTGGGPDEGMRSLIPRCIINGNLLPSGYDHCAIYHLGNWSYAFYPQMLGGYFSAAFMAVAKVLGASASIVYMSGRIASVCFGLLAVFALNRTIGIIYARRNNIVLIRCIATVLLGFWPQFAFLSSYMNNDIVALSGVAVLTYALVSGLKNRWTVRSAVVLAIGIVLCGLGYWNSYGFILMAVIIFLISVCMQNRGNAMALAKIIGTAAGLSAVLILPWFMVNLVRYDDLIGMTTFHNRYEAWLNGGGLVLQHPYRHGIFDLLLKTDFVESTVDSFIGRLGYMSVVMPLKLSLIYRAGVVVGMILALAQFPRLWRSAGFRMMAVGWGIASSITLALFLYYTVHTDYQPQGRYIIYLLIPLVIAMVVGFVDAFRLDSRTIMAAVIVGLIVYAIMDIWFFQSAVMRYGWSGIHWKGAL